MSIIREIVTELFGMFVADARLSAAIFGVVLIAAGLIDVAHLAPILGGAALLAGTVAVLLVSVRRAARRR